MPLVIGVAARKRGQGHRHHNTWNDATRTPTLLGRDSHSIYLSLGFVSFAHPDRQISLQPVRRPPYPARHHTRQHSQEPRGETQTAPRVNDLFHRRRKKPGHDRAFVPRLENVRDPGLKTRGEGQLDPGLREKDGLNCTIRLRGISTFFQLLRASAGVFGSCRAVRLAARLSSPDSHQTVATAPDAGDTRCRLDQYVLWRTERAPSDRKATTKPAA